MNVLFVTNGDDWEGLYIDGVLAIEGHRISAWEAMCVLGINSHSAEIDTPWMHDMGNLPVDFCDIPQDKIKGMRLVVKHNQEAREAVKERE